MIKVVVEGGEVITAYVGFAADDETKITGIMIEHFSKWLLLPGQAERGLQPV